MIDLIQSLFILFLVVQNILLIKRLNKEVDRIDRFYRDTHQAFTRYRREIRKLDTKIDRGGL